MNIVQKILKINVYAGLSVDSSLFIGDQVVELHDTHGDCFILLSLNHQLAELNILDELLEDRIIQIAALGEIPPVLTGKRGVGVVPQILKKNNVRNHCVGTYLQNRIEFLLM